MSTKTMFELIKTTFYKELSSDESLLASDLVRLAESNWEQLGSAYHESYNSHVQKGLDIYSEIFSKVNEQHSIPKTLELFNAYRDAALA